MPKKFIEKAARMALSESLGYDEGRAYYFMLKNDEIEMKKEFSHSRKYRVLKMLFDRGAVAKYKPQKQDYFSYVLLPPSFLYLERVDEEIISYLEKLYMDNYPGLLENNFSQLILKSERGLVIFLLKYYMKEKASVMIDFDFRFLGKKSSMISLTKKDTERKAGVIDGKIAFEFSKIYNGSTEDNVGYIARDAENPGRKNYINKIEKKLEMKQNNPPTIKTKKDLM